MLQEREMRQMENSAVAEKTSRPCQASPVTGAARLTYRAVKRAFDFTAALLLSVLLALPVAVLMLLIRLDSPGPAIYRQERLGKDGKPVKDKNGKIGKPFTILKLRTMRLDAEKNGPRWAETNDSRCTRLGRFLRKTRIDELPQLWNILRGEMSFVGPRPERAYFYDQFEQYIPEFRDRLAAVPGLTGWAQINGGYTLRPEEKIVYDMEYIKERSLRMDVKCLLMTVPIMLTHNGAR